MDNDNAGWAKRQWKNNSWVERRVLWNQVEPMVRAQLILLREEGALGDDGEKFYKSVIESKAETYFTRGGAALALCASRKKEDIFYLASRMDRDSENFDSSEYVRGMCAQAIGRNAEFVESLSEEGRGRILAVLRKMLDDESVIVVENAVFALGQLLDYGSEGRMYAATTSKLYDVHPATGENKVRWETLALAFCEMGCTETFAAIAYIKVLEESMEHKVAEKVAEAVDGLLTHSSIGGKERLAKALELYMRKSALSSMASGSGSYRVDSVIGAVFEKPRFVGRGAELEVEPKTSRLMLKSR